MVIDNDAILILSWQNDKMTNDGKVKGIKKGKCTIYVYSINGLTKKARITVK